MKIAITGASGHLGSAILPELLSRNHQARVLVKDAEKLLMGMPLEMVRGNVLEINSLRSLMEGCDALIHCAAIISINGDPTGIVYQTNVEGTRRVMEIARECGVKRVIHISSIHAYNQYPCHEILDEQRDTVNEKAFAYDKSKKAGQEIALSMNGKDMEVIVVNPTSIIGPYDHKPSKMGRVIIDLYSGRLPFVIKGGFDFCDSRDVATAVLNALVMARPGENYLLGGKWYSFTELVQVISNLSGKKIKVLCLPPILGWLGLPFVSGLARIGKKEPIYTREALEAIQSGNRRISSEKARHELDYQSRPLEETIADALHWFGQNGYLV